MKNILLLFTTIIIIGVCLFLFVLKQNATQISCNTPTPQLICGTINYATTNSQQAVDGKKLFNVNCAACHKLDKKMVGPALRQVAKKYNFISIKNHLKDKKASLKSKTYNTSCLVFKHLSDKDISNILSYTE
ncbi:cytochrome c [uncultured Lacinutrix sp.]|uniref:c-type cytochrome n=1 Tax=Lacinutrix sp. MedPE-SW TaxID=1860087 RepID=UPI0009179A56|nr:MAG: hypothetical protein BM549_03145 [Lacinutrix sp. MedPE-SW]